MPLIICSLENAMSSDQRSGIDLHTGLPLLRPETHKKKIQPRKHPRGQVAAGFWSHTRWAASRSDN